MRNQPPSAPSPPKKSGGTFHQTVSGDFVKSLMGWHAMGRMTHPWREAYKVSKDPYVVWVAEVMLQQTTITAVSDKYIRFIQTLPHLRSLACAETHLVRSLTAGLGYYRRFDLMHELAQTLIAHNQHLPSSYDELIKLKGIGPYTAGAISSICFQQPVPVIDGNVKRLICRIYDLRTHLTDPIFKAPLFDMLSTVICRISPGLFNEALMELGQRVCKPKSPLCSECPVRNHCQAYEKQSQPLNPPPSQSPPRTSLNCTLHIITHSSQVGLRKRPHHSPILKNRMGFPTTFDHQLAQSTLIGEFAHAITRFNIKAVVCHRPLSSGLNSSSPITWIPYDHVDQQLISSFDQKAWRLFKNTIL